jgi:protein TonB
LLQPTLAPDTPFVERLRAGVGRRAVGIGLALTIEGLLLLALLSLQPAERPGKEEERITAVNLDANEPLEAPEPSSPKPKQRAEEQPGPRQPATDEPLPSTPAETLPPPQPAKPTIAPIPPATTPMPLEQPATIPRSTVRPAPPARQPYGPPDTGGSPGFRDTERVGTAPNGEPLYAAAWYREPKPEQLRGYLSTASGPGWGLIACRTVPDYRVEDCVALDEYPQGSQINRAVLAAAWEFRVRPPFLGGRPLVGSWVRIRIDYGFERR